MTSEKAKKPIGIFDSGIGGLTVAHAIAKHLPNEEIIYFGDTAHLPYGDKSADAIRYYCLRIVKFLIDQGCKMIVIACNSASSTAYNVLLEFFDQEVLFVNVVDPLIKAATGMGIRKTGLIATKATVQSRMYERKLKEKAPGMKLVAMATPLLVPMIEEGYFRNKVSQAILQNYLSDPSFNDIEALLLACTHYPLIKEEISEFFGGKVNILDSTDVVALEVEAGLKGQGWLNDQKRKQHQFYVSDFTPSFEHTTRLFYGEEVHLEHFPIW